MSIEELLGKSGEELEKMTNAELQAYFAPYLVFIKPLEKNEQEDEGGLVRVSTQKRKSSITHEAQKAIDMAERMAKQLGMKI